MTSEDGEASTAEARRGPGTLRCSFCQKSQADVRALIAGPNVFICDECVEVCRDILDPAIEATVQAAVRHALHGPSQSGPEAAAEENDAQGASSLLCNLCRLPTPVHQLTLIPQRGALCHACIDAVLRATDASVEEEPELAR